MHGEDRMWPAEKRNVKKIGKDQQKKVINRKWWCGNVE